MNEKQTKEKLMKREEQDEVSRNGDRRDKQGKRERKEAT